MNLKSNNNNLTIYHDFYIEASLATIFDVITQPEHLINWWPSKCTGNPKQNESFHIKMTESIEGWNTTTFGFDLLKENDKIRVKFQHYGWSELTKNYKITSYCWTMLLNGLKNYIEKGDVIPFEERS